MREPSFGANATLVRRSSEEVCLLHDPQEFLLVDLAVAIPVCLVDHLLQLLISHPLAELLGDALEVPEGDLLGIVVIKELEGLEDLLLRITVEDLESHHLQELRVLDGPTAVVVHVTNHLGDLLLLRLETECPM